MCFCCHRDGEGMESPDSPVRPSTVTHPVPPRGFLSLFCHMAPTQQILSLRSPPSVCHEFHQESLVEGSLPLFRILLVVVYLPVVSRQHMLSFYLPTRVFCEWTNMVVKFINFDAGQTTFQILALQVAVPSNGVLLWSV